MKRTPRFLLCIFRLFLAMAFLVPFPAFAQDVNDMSAEELAAYIVSLASMLEEKQNEAEAVFDDKPAADSSISVQFNNKTYIGTYTGDIKNNVPHGEGRFEGASNNKMLIYEGNWNNGLPAGRGNLECENYTIHFDDSQGIYDRTGQFKGEVVNLSPSGYGTFNTVNSMGEPWTYVGDWKNGVFHGQGMQKWNTPSNANYIGTYVNGRFSPTYCDALITFSGFANFSVSERSKSFINNHLHLFDKKRSISSGKWKPTFAADGSVLPSTNNLAPFKSSSIPSHLVHSFFHIREFKKKPSLYDQKLLHVTDAHVIQVVSFELGTSAFEEILFETSDGTTYYGYLQGSSSIVEDMQIEAYVLPLDYATYESVSGEEIWAVFCAITSNIQEAYETLQKGSSGSNVLNMKYRMQELGYFNADANLSNSYNNTCVERVKQFQTVNHLPVTGIADHATLSLLYSDRAKSKP